MCEISPNPTGFKLTAAKSLDEYAKLDAEDESLARWKASLGIVPGASATASGPKVSTICGPELYMSLPIILPGDRDNLGTRIPHSPTWKADRLQAPRYRVTE